MGCDYEVYIQGLYPDCDDSSVKRWVELYCAKTKTSCGGYPIREILRSLVRDGEADGSYGDAHTADSYSGMDFWPIENRKQELQELDKLYDSDGKMVKSNGQDSQPPAEKRQKGEADDRNLLSPEDVLQECQKLAGEIHDLQKKLEERGVIGTNPEWSYFFLSVPEFRRFLTILKDFEDASYGSYYEEEFAPLMEWCRILGNDDLKSLIAEDGSHVYPTKDYITEAIAKWYENLAHYNGAKKMMPTVCDAVGKDDVGEKILSFCGRPRPLDFRFAIIDDEGRTECFRKGDLKGANNCCIM